MGQKGYREPQGIEPCQLASSGFLVAPLRSGADLFPSLFCVFFCVCSATEEPSARDPWAGFRRCVLLYLANTNCLP